MIIDEGFKEVGYEAEVKKFIDGKALLYYLEQIEPSWITYAPKPVVSNPKLNCTASKKVERVK